MPDNVLTNANRYFTKSTQKVYIDRVFAIESFEEYLNHRYRDSCYYYSAYALMGLNPNDYLVRGNIDVPGRHDYHHGWVEFEFEGKAFLFDSMVKKIVYKEDWYESFNPRIDYKKTQKEILNKFLNENCAFKIKDGFWQFKDIVLNSNRSLTYSKIIENDMKNGHVPTALRLARIEISKYTSKVTRFIAYSEPSG